VNEKTEPFPVAQERKYYDKAGYIHEKEFNQL
jgi:hypothetical protein